MRIHLATAAASLLALAACDAAPIDEPIHAEVGHPAVGRLLGAGCLGTLTHDARTIVTAAHCLKDAWAFEIGGRQHSFAGAIKRPHPDYVFATDHMSCLALDGFATIPCSEAAGQGWAGWQTRVAVLHDDIAVITLAQPVEGIAPVALPRHTQRVAVGDVVEHVGRDVLATGEIEEALREVLAAGPDWYVFEGAGRVAESGGSSNLVEAAAAVPCLERVVDETDLVERDVLVGVHSTGMREIWGVDMSVAHHVGFILPCEQRVDQASCRDGGCFWDEAQVLCSAEPDWL